MLTIFQILFIVLSIINLVNILIRGVREKEKRRIMKEIKLKFKESYDKFIDDNSGELVCKRLINEKIDFTFNVGKEFPQYFQVISHNRLYKDFMTLLLATIYCEYGLLCQYASPFNEELCIYAHIG